MNQENGLGYVTIKKEKLIEAIKENLEKHISELVSAQAAYRVAIVKFLEEEGRKARAAAKKKELYRIDCYHDAPPIPPDHTESYKEVISMLEMSVKEEVVITRAEFKQYVLDEWSWKGDFAVSAARVMDYSPKKR